VTTVLVTGGSGFLGLHAVLQLLQRGEWVRTTLRSRERELLVREALARAGVEEAGARLSFAVADLFADAGWPEAMAGVERVLHVASPFPAGDPAHEDDLIVPARDGTLRVLRAARDAGVRRIVLTSSFAAIGYGRAPGDHIFTEADWTDPEADVGAYIRSKTLAERAAWDFVERVGGLELAVINPVAMFGPLLGPDRSASVGLIARLLDGTMERGMPRLGFAAVDVRDVADLHLRAMDDPAAVGERFLAAAGDGMWLADAAMILHEFLGGAADRVPLTEIPDDVLRAAAAVDPALERIAQEVGRLHHVSAEKARRVLGWRPRSREEAILATAESLLRQPGAPRAA
jgi:dihydroflavonol-4-reductase